MQSFFSEGNWKHEKITKHGLNVPKLKMDTRIQPTFENLHELSANTTESIVSKENWKHHEI